jgi:hypothetical protein
MSNHDRAPSLGESYLCRASADILLSAGFAQAGNTRGAMALTLYRISEDWRLHAVAVQQAKNPDPPRTLPDELIALHAWCVPRLRRQFPAMRHSVASGVAERVLRWHLSDVCTACNGRGYALISGTQIVSDSLCTECNGTDHDGRSYQGMGRPPVERRLKRQHREAGRWLASEFASMLTYVLSEMAKRLRGSMDINLDAAPALAARLVELRSVEAQED